MPATTANASRKMKKTAIGDVPGDWEIRRLEEIVVLNPRPEQRLVGDVLVSFVPMASVTGHGEFIDVAVVPFKKVANGFTYFADGDVLVAKITPCFENGKGALARGMAGGIGFGSTEFHVIRPSDEINREFLFYHTASHRFRVRGVSSMTGSAGQKRLPAEYISAYHIALPPIREQQRIAAVLGAWDRALAGLEKLLAAKQQRKQALMQQLLTGQKRLKGYRGAWTSTRLREVASESQLRNNGALSRELLLAVTKKDGMIPMRENVRGVSDERCKIVRTGWFAYNPMRLNIGSIARWEARHDAMVSGDYVVFQCDESKLSSAFLHHYRRTHRWERFVETAGNGSVRVRIWFADLAAMKLKLPAIDEQRRIAAVLDDCNRELALLERKLVALREQKKGLMQQLLTGKVRVKG